MAKINLFYLSPNTYGGWVTFTAHLVGALKAAGHEPVLRKLGAHTENKTRPFGYGRFYQNTDESDCYQLAMNEPCLIVAAAKKYRFVTEEMLSLGAKIVVHDPTEFKNFDGRILEAKNCVVVRRTGLRGIPGATFIRHPYERQGKIGQPEFRQNLAAATSRIDFDKYTNLILDANRILPPHKQIHIHGFENRLYTKFKIEPKYPEWHQSKAQYARDMDTAFNILRDASFLVDMSMIQGDGGGTQYTFLEAWDAGAVPILNTAWEITGDDMKDGINCHFASNGEEIAFFLNMYEEDDYGGDRLSFVQAGYECLKSHDPELIGQQYAHFMGL